MDPKQAVHVSAWCYPMQSAALLRIRTQPCAAVEQGSELFKQEQELKVPLTQGACHMETGRKKTRTSHKEEVEMTKPNQELLRCCFPTWEGQMSSAPLGCGLLAARVSHLRLSSQHFPPCTLSAGVSIFTNLLHRGLICLFSAAVAWTGEFEMQQFWGVQLSTMPPSTAPAAPATGAGEATAGQEVAVMAGKTSSMDPAWGVLLCRCAQRPARHGGCQGSGPTSVV